MQRFGLVMIIPLLTLVAGCGRVDPAATRDAAQETRLVTPRLVVPPERDQKPQCQSQSSETSVAQGVSGIVSLNHCASGAPCGAQNSPIDGAIIEARRGNHTESVRSACGRFSVPLPAGEYVLSAVGGRAIGYKGTGKATCPSRRAIVRESRNIFVSFECRLA